MATAEDATEPPEKSDATKPAGGVGLGATVGLGLGEGAGDGVGEGLGDVLGVAVWVGWALGLCCAIGDAAHALTTNIKHSAPISFLMS